MRFVDLSHVIEHRMVTYPGLPGPEIGEHLSFDASAGHYVAGTEFAIGRVRMVANTGTYLDTPAHRFRNGHDLTGLPLRRCADLPALVVDADGPIGPEMFADVAVTGSAVLLRSGWDRHWGTDHYGDPSHPYLTGDGARAVVERGAALVGIDSVNIDDTTTRRHDDGRAAGAHTVAGCGYTDRRAPHEPGRPSAHWSAVHRRSPRYPRARELPGPSLRDRAGRPAPTVGCSGAGTAETPSGCSPSVAPGWPPSA